MKAPDFVYHRPESVQDALALLAQDPDAAPLAGGQSLMPMMNFRLARPEALVDLNGIASLSGVSREGDTVRIGAMTRYAELEASALVQKHLPLIAMALPHIAHDAIRNRGTIGGSVALADPAAEMPALLLALNAVVRVTGPGGERQIAADEFFKGMYETDLRAGELVTAIDFPLARPSDRFGFIELARRHGDYAMAGVAVAAIDTLRIAFFSVADKAVRATRTEEILGQSLSDIDPAIVALEDIDFGADLNASAAAKRHLAGVVLLRALEGLAP